jgi:CHAT domain-containing protein/tetratricopeptide (TPR) repeat protein
LAAATATDLLVEALLLNGRGAQQRTRELAVWAVRTKERLLKSDDVQLSPSLRNLGNTLMVAGEAQEGLSMFERSLTIQERVPGGDNVAVAEALDDVGRAQLRCNRYDEARRSFLRAQIIKEGRLKPDDVRIARTLQELARIHQSKGEYPAARLLLDRTVGIREAAAPQHPDMIDTLNLVGSQLWFEGADPKIERAVYARALAIGQNVLRHDHPLLALPLRNLAIAERELGDFEESKRLRTRALSIAEENYGPSHVEVGGYLNDLANISFLQGDYVGARNLYKRAVQIAEKNRAPDDTLATAVYNLANVDDALGDFGEARRQFERALQVWQRVFGPQHPYIARTLSALGTVSVNQGRDAEARILFERALRIQERRLRLDHRDVSLTLADLAATLQQQGLTSRARELSIRSVAIWERGTAANDSPVFARILVRHAKLEATQGSFESARVHYERALAIRAPVLGTSHPQYAEAQAGLAVALTGIGDAAGATANALQADEIIREHLRMTLRHLPERQSLAYAATRPKGLDLAMSLRTDPETITRVFDALVRSRALVLDEMAARHRLRIDESGDLAPLWTSLTSARQRLANLVVRGPSDQRPEQYLKLVEDARREKERAETALAEKSATFRSELSREEIGLDAVRKALPLGSALVAFVRYDRTVIADTKTATGTSGKRLRTVPSYMAFIAHSERPDVAMVPLGAAASLDTLVTNWHAEVVGIIRASSQAEAERTYRVAGAQLRQRVWDPLAAHLKDAINVFVVPDGVLNVVTLAALPTGRTTYLVDNGPVIHYLSAERDLVTGPSQSSSGRGLLALGGAAFDDSTSFSAARPAPRVTKVPTSTGKTTRGACGDLPSLHFDPLEATGREVQDVASLWTGSPIELLQNASANERAFKQSAPGRRVLHLATHGFFLGSDCVTEAAGTRGVGGLSRATTTRSNADTADNPLLLSGLALAGANRRAAASPKDEDGILTAEEVASLNLDGVDWAVLSACDTGLGVVKAGEGVFGLRRAFLVAGVHTVIMSLWQVEDESARAWMRALYEGRLKRKLNTAQAVQQASLTVLRDRRAAKQATHPFYWAGFAAAGDWR